MADGAPPNIGSKDVVWEPRRLRRGSVARWGPLPYATGGAYSNFLTAEETDRVKSAFGPNYARLEQVKKSYDPLNFFRLNQNI